MAHSAAAVHPPGLLLTRLSRSPEPPEGKLVSYEPFAQILQQSRSFGSTFKFPESGDESGNAEAGAASGAAFGAQEDDDDLYA